MVFAGYPIISEPTDLNSGLPLNLGQDGTGTYALYPVI